MLKLNRRTVLQASAAALAAWPSVLRAAALPRLPLAPIADGIFVTQGRHELTSAENAGHIANLGFVLGDDAIAVIDTGGSARTGEALMAAMVVPVPLGPKEGLALLNGTQVSTALALSGLIGAERNAAAAMLAGAMSIDR